MAVMASWLIPGLNLHSHPLNYFTVDDRADGNQSVSLTSKDVMTVQWTDRPNVWIYFAYLNSIRIIQDILGAQKWRWARPYWGRRCRFFLPAPGGAWILKLLSFHCLSQNARAMSSITRIVPWPGPYRSRFTFKIERLCTDISSYDGLQSKRTLSDSLQSHSYD